MALKENHEYLELSLKYPEGLREKYYIIDKVIICDEGLVKKIHQLRDTIAAYNCFRKKKDEEAKTIRRRLVSELHSLLETTENIQYSEFVAFWATQDMTYSIYQNLEKEKQLDVLKSLLESFCERREELYKKVGYSDVSVQVLYDSGASRRKGTAGVQKMIHLLNEISDSRDIGIEKIKSANEFYKPFWYFAIEKRMGRAKSESASLFSQFRAFFSVIYPFGKARQKKLPDLIVWNGSRALVIEAKHLKEGGGGQSKQVGELIDFINQKEQAKNIHYVSFADGTYFNKFINAYQKEDKIADQRRDIEKALRKFRQNFFVNTMGLIEIFNDVFSEYEEIH